MARISYVEKENAPDDIKAIYDQVQGKLGIVPNVLKAMANSPEMFKGFVPFLSASMGETQVDPKLKELAILTTAKINGCSYCTAHHTAAGKRAGLTENQINAVPDTSSPDLDEKEKAVVRFSKEVARDVSGSQESIDQLRKHFDDSQIA